MKKIMIIMLVGLFVITGCGKKVVTPTEKVEQYLTFFQEREKGVVEKLSDWIMDQDLEEDLRSTYQDIMEKQYQNLSYEILKEEIEDDKATVVVEIEVLNYQASLEKSKDYFLNHQEEFFDIVKEQEEVEKTKEYKEYRIKELQNVKDKTKYQITFQLTKRNKEWVIDEIDNATFLKMYGIY